MAHHTNPMWTGRGIYGVLLAFILIVSLVVSSAPGVKAQAGVPDLFSASAAPADAARADAAQVMRSRFVSVNVGLLVNAKGAALDVKANPQVSLNLFPDASYVGTIDKVEKNSSGGYSWIGRLQGVEDGYFYLVMVGNVFIAHVASPAGVYEVSWAGNNVYKVVQIDQSKFGEDYPREMPEPGPVLTKADLGPEADSGATIDIMVVYTSAARIAEGSTEAMKARIALAVTETNQSYANDGIIPRLRLVHVQEYAYTETGNLGTDLARLVSSTDAYFTTVHSLRNTYGADMVSLIVENGGPYCGLANAIMATAAGAFQVTARSCATGYYSFGHEFGHLQGARHDPYVDGSTTPFSYGHGYVHTGSTTATRWRTIMAYNNKCSNLGYDCTRLQWWSNPTKTWLGALMGAVGLSENYKVLNATRVTVANFRAQRIGNNFASSFNASAAGWAPVYGMWQLFGGAWLLTPGVANVSSSIAHTGLYGDLTYQASLWRFGCASCANRIIIRGNPGSLDSGKWWKPSLVFQYTNTGQFSVYYISSGGTYKALQDWTISQAIVRDNWNTLRVVAVGSTLNFYINGQLVWSGVAAVPATGRVGIGMYTDSTMGNLLYVDSAILATTATAGSLGDAAVQSGVVVPGGNFNQSP